MKQIGSYLAFLLFLTMVNTLLAATMFQQGVAARLSGVRAETDSFRQLSITEEQLALLASARRASVMRPGELLTILKADVPGASFVKWKLLLLRYNPQDFARVSGYYSAILNDIACFPVAADGVFYENSWMFERNYGGKRGHEGTDLMPPENLRGQYQVVSMTDGVVERIGWLPLGGYRIGIRSPSGGYFYYAHLDSYSREFRKGEFVTAGTVLGWMGDSGYGPEGTRGKFDVHLHLGIYIRTEAAEELSVNPYWVLRYAREL